MSLNKSLRKKIYERDKYICKYCLSPVVEIATGNERVATVDHVIPKREGGQTTESNLITCCSWCNSRKEVKPKRYASIKMD